MKIEHQNLDVKRESMEKEKESLNKSDAVALKRREAELITELNGQQKTWEKSRDSWSRNRLNIRMHRIRLKQKKTGNMRKKKNWKSL